MAEISAEASPEPTRNLCLSVTFLPPDCVCTALLGVGAGLGNWSCRMQMRRCDDFPLSVEGHSWMEEIGLAVAAGQMWFSISLLSLEKTNTCKEKKG